MGKNSYLRAAEYTDDIAAQVQPSGATGHQISLGNETRRWEFLRWVRRCFCFCQKGFRTKSVHSRRLQIILKGSTGVYSSVCFFRFWGRLLLEFLPCSLKSVLVAEPLTLRDNSVEQLGLPGNSIELGWIWGHKAVQAEVKSSFPLILCVEILNSIVLSGVSSFLSIVKQIQSCHIRFWLT